MWEYNRYEVKFDSAEILVDKLNVLGKDNWEIIYYTEKKPEKFGDKYEIVVFVKRLKPASHE